ncbi:MAG: hypothetical protein A2516_09300 [Alphaproteobacteria bacterium RIFOXYD12_FULL_60_8]|nr:MAG: hypothetical protein A2516_09300 [Alphaproteobacteria bacterium RIFOXYD12_FULL_60_8]
MNRTNFAAALGEGREWSGAVKSCLLALGAPPVGANLGFVYVTEALSIDLTSILTFLRQKTKVEHWVGCVGVGVFGVGREVRDGAAVSILVGAFPEDSFRLLPPLKTGDEPFAEELKVWLDGAKEVFGLVHADPRDEDTQSRVAKLATRTGAMLAGGLTVVNRGRQQVAGAPWEAAVSGVLFNGKAVLSSGLSQGCTPIGPEHQVTDCAENVLIGLGGQPALEVLKRDMGDLLSRDVRRAAGFIHAAFVEPDGYLVRSLLGVDAGKSAVAVAAQPEVGLRVAFVKRDPMVARQDLRDMLERLTQRLGGHPRGGVYIADAGRAAEIEVVQEVLGTLPLTGFIANGEISGRWLHAYSAVLVLFA